MLGGDPVPTGSFQHRPPPHLPISATTVAIELTAGKADLIDWSDTSLIRRDGVTGHPVWDAFRPPKPFAPGRDPLEWIKKASVDHLRMNILETAPDLDGDGTGDLVCAIGNNPAILAVSGADGSMLWSHVAELDGPGGAAPLSPTSPATRAGRVLGVFAVADVDHDGTPDLVVTLVIDESRRTSRDDPNKKPSSHLLRLVALSAGASSPPFRGDRAAGSGLTRSIGRSPIIRTYRGTALPHSVRGRRSEMVVIVNDAQWVGLAAATGWPRAGPIDLGFEPVRPVQHADLDGDGEPEILVVGPGTVRNAQTLAAFSSTTGQQWVAAIRDAYSAADDFSLPPDWPLMFDLDGDGRAEIVVPESGTMPPSRGFRGVRMLDGRSGRDRWTQPLSLQDKGGARLAHFVQAPDLNGDGVHDLIVVSQYERRLVASSLRSNMSEPAWIYVDALSGKDGHPLWWWRVDFPKWRLTRIWTPRWWGRGPDGWPLLAFGLGGRLRGSVDMDVSAFRLNPPTVHVLESSTGREVHTVAGLTNPRSADFDGDGLVDLWGEVEGELRAFRGEPPEAWRALGGFAAAAANPASADETVQPAADFDGDGIADTLSSLLQAPGNLFTNPDSGSRTLVARSGRDGGVLWKSQADRRKGWYEADRGEFYEPETFPLPHGDFDGDGTADVVVQRIDPNYIQSSRAQQPCPSSSSRVGPAGISGRRAVASGLRGIRVPANWQGSQPRCRARAPTRPFGST